MEDILDFIKPHSRAAGSGVSFDYIVLWPGTFDANGVRELIQFNTAKQSGESGAGFSIEEGALKFQYNWVQQIYEENLQTSEDGTLYGKITCRLRVVLAVISG